VDPLARQQSNTGWECIEISHPFRKRSRDGWERLILACAWLNIVMPFRSQFLLSLAPSSKIPLRVPIQDDCTFFRSVLTQRLILPHFSLLISFPYAMKWGRAISRDLFTEVGRVGLRCAIGVAVKRRDRTRDAF
jgi:hypothetical protein